MPEQRPNILLIMTDQQRGDCLGIDGHPVLQTPYLDWIAASGVRFNHAYSACPICLPARRTVLTGRKPSGHGVFVNNNEAPLPFPTMAGELQRAGYQTHLIGKSHWGSIQPDEAGFETSQNVGGPMRVPANAYQDFLRDNGVLNAHAARANGMWGNGYPARPWHLEERLHFSNWIAEQFLEFLENRDPDRPFFSWVNFLHPHQPLTPPQFYYDKYMAMDLPEPVVGDWAKVYEEPVRGLEPEPWRISLDPPVMKQIRAAYYGCIEHIDHQIARMIHHVILPENTVILFASDHGEMLGDHQWFRKRNAFESSARIPFLLKFPKGMDVPQEQVLEHPVELMDVMPTVLDIAGVDTPNTVQGQSLLPLIRNPESPWRDFIHGECSDVPTTNSGMQYVTNGRRKFIWFPGQNRELYFDLEADPEEMNNLIEDAARQEEIETWRRRLIEELKDRPERFTDGTRLIPQEGPTVPVLKSVVAPENQSPAG